MIPIFEIGAPQAILHQEFGWFLDNSRLNSVKIVRLSHVFQPYTKSDIKCRTFTILIM